MSQKHFVPVSNDFYTSYLEGHGCKNFKKAVAKLGKVHKELRKLGMPAQKALKDCLFHCGGSEERWWQLAEQKWKHYCGDHSLCSETLNCKSHHIKDPQAQAAFIVSVAHYSLTESESLEGMGCEYKQIQVVFQYK